MEFDSVYIATAGLMAALLTVPSMLVFAMAFSPQVIVNLIKMVPPPAEHLLLCPVT